MPQNAALFSGGCPNESQDAMAIQAVADAGNRIADAINRLADEAKAGREDFEPIVEFFGGATTRLEKTCLFLKAHRVKIVLAIVAILSAANWLPPAVADTIKTLVAH